MEYTLIRGQYAIRYDDKPTQGLESKSETARAAGKGLWPRSTADPDGAANVDNEQTLQDLVIWPKLLRRVVSYFAANHDNLDNLDPWLRNDGRSRDDEIFRLDTQEPARLHDLVTASGGKLGLTVWPKDLDIEPRS